MRSAASVTPPFQGTLVVAQLPSSLSYGQASWPVRKVPLRRTPLRVAYHPGMRVYAVATAAAVAFAPAVVDENGYDQFGMDELDPNRKRTSSNVGDGDTDTRPRVPTEHTAQPMTAPELDHHQLELVVPGAWQTIDWCAR